MDFARRSLYFLAVLAILFATLPRLRADVTIRYQTDLKPAPALQPLMGQMLKAMPTASGITIQMRGSKGYTAFGAWTEVFDFDKQEVTLLDPAHKTFATLPMSQLADKMAGAMPQLSSAQSESVQKAMASIKSDVSSKMTGKTAEIQGVQAEEREIALSMDIPMPAGMAQSGPSLKLVMHMWNATKDEALRVQAIRELTGYQAWQRYMLNPAGTLEKIFGKIPGMSSTISPLLAEIGKNQTVMMRSHMELYMPMLAAVAQKMAPQGSGAPAIDPNAPLMEVTQEVTELSTAPVDASLFEIPKDYKSLPADDMIRDMMKAQTPAKTN